MHDSISVAQADGLSLDIEGPFSQNLGAGEDNLVMRAARALAGHAGIEPKAHITLAKNLPVASGIGGGSADAAATLRALRSLWAADIDDAAMASLGLALGADVPVCLLGRTARVQGIGEVLSPVAVLPETGIVLVNPGIAVATRDVFSGRTGDFSVPAELPPSFGNAAALVDALVDYRNDLAPPALALCPVIGEVLSAIERADGCLLARLSGSGATCFGLFSRPDEARAAAAAIARINSAWWVRAGRFLPATPEPRRVD